MIGKAYRLVSRSNWILLCATVHKENEFKYRPDSKRISHMDTTYLTYNIFIDKLSQLTNFEGYEITTIDEKDSLFF
jgi:hypothetical protein